jgi:hypothetical protein
MAPSRHRESGPVYAVGHSVMISAAPGDEKPGVTLMDALATVTHGTLAHGARVEILAWQPQGSNGTRYQVRSATEGLEGWLSGRQLRAYERPAVARIVAAGAPPKRVAAAKKPAAKRVSSAR